MQILTNIKHWFASTARVFAQEWRTVLHDPGVLTFFVLLPLAYPVIYTLIYNPEVLRDIPVAVVDQDRSEASRKLVRDADASPEIGIAQYCTDMAEAKDLVARRQAHAILFIPAGYGKRIGRFETAHASFFVEMSLLLRYRDFAMSLSEVQLKDIADITGDRKDAVGIAGRAIGGAPITSSANMMGDTQQGFASFIMPAIVVLILQQSMLLGIAMLGGTSRQRRRANGGIDPQMVAGAPASATVWGRALCYVVFYIAPTIYALHWVPSMFSLPHQGSALQWGLLALPFLLGTAFFGQTLNALVRDRESSFIVMVITSVVFLFLAGFTWPRYAFPPFWQWVSNFVPATWGVQAFIHINCNNATLAQNADRYLWLWLLAALYFATSVLTLKLTGHRSRRATGAQKQQPLR